MPRWATWFIIIAMLLVPILNYEMGYENGSRNCYGCGAFDEPLVPRLWGPWFDFSGEKQRG